METEPTALIESSLIAFAEETLGLDLYPWQAAAILPFDRLSAELTQVSLVTPNGSGKSAVVITTLVLGHLAMYPKGRVVLTTADGKQLDGQVMPAIEGHRAKFPEWMFTNRSVQTPTGGRFVAFTTDQAGRAEGWHKLDDIEGPLLIICDEAKTIPDDIFSAIDRCTFNGLLLASSPGQMSGRFYETQVKPGLGFVRIGVGLLDCPHIGKDKIDRVVALHGPDSPFTRSTLYGEFMEGAGEARFDREGLTALKEQCDAEDATPAHQRAKLGDLIEQADKALVWAPHAGGWVWMSEEPTFGRRYIAFGDPMTGAQSEGSLKRDTHAAGIIGLAYRDERGVEHDDEVVAALHHEGGCRWDNDVLAERLSMLVRHYGDCPIIVEANNSGTEVMRLLLLAGRHLWRREKPNHRLPGKKMIDVVGFQTNTATKGYWIGALGTAIRERTLVCRYRMAVEQFATFILNEAGRGEAQPGCFDDFVTGIGLGLFAKSSAKMLVRPNYNQLAPAGVPGPWS